MFVRKMAKFLLMHKHACKPACGDAVGWWSLKFTVYLQHSA